MRLQHWNRIRRSGRGRIVLEVDAGECVGYVPKSAEFQNYGQRAALNCPAKSGNTEIDWLQADIELRDHYAQALCA